MRILAIFTILLATAALTGCHWCCCSTFVDHCASGTLINDSGPGNGVQLGHANS